MNQTDKKAIKDFFETLDEKQKMYNEVKYMHPEDQRLVLPLYLDDKYHIFIESIISDWEEEKRNESNTDTDTNRNYPAKRKKRTQSCDTLGQAKGNVYSESWKEVSSESENNLGNLEKNQ